MPYSKSQARASDRALGHASMLLRITVSRAGSGVSTTDPVLDGQRRCEDAADHAERGEDHVGDCLASRTSTGAEVEEGLFQLGISAEWM